MSGTGSGSLRLESLGYLNIPVTFLTWRSRFENSVKKAIKAFKLWKSVYRAWWNVIRDCFCSQKYDYAECGWSWFGFRNDAIKQYSDPQIGDTTWRWRAGLLRREQLNSSCQRRIDSCRRLRASAPPRAYQAYQRPVRRRFDASVTMEFATSRV